MTATPPAPANDAPERVVLDTSAILSGRDLPYPPDRMVIPPAVHDELQPGGRDHRRLTYLESAGLQTHEPTPKSRRTVQNSARHTGDLPKLSETDLEVLALAHTLQAPVVTDDYRIQNVARHLQLPHHRIHQRGIRHTRHHVHQCTGCHRTYDTPPAGHECPTCGSPLRTRKR